MVTDNHFVIILLICFAAGFVKGLIGMGFPTVVLALLSLFIGLRDAMAVLLLPCLLTNLWQALNGGRFVDILRKIWPFLGPATVMIFITTSLLSHLSVAGLATLLGSVVFLYGLTGLTRMQISLPGKHAPWLSPLLGVVNGAISGLTGTFVFPGLIYLRSLNLGKNGLVQSMGILFLVSTLSLGLGLLNNDLVKEEFLATSVVAILPSFGGMAAGQVVRRRMTEKRFDTFFFSFLIFLGAYIFFRNVI